MEDGMMGRGESCAVFNRPPSCTGIDLARPVIFLDIDGVLNNQVWNSKNGGYGGFVDTDTPTLEGVLWCPANVEALLELVYDTDAQIVISSTWRELHTLERFEKMFELYSGSEDTELSIIGMTGIAKNRGQEVADFVNTYNVKNYVILDDNDDFSFDQKHRFVKTKMTQGLTEQSVLKAKCILLDMTKKEVKTTAGIYKEKMENKNERN